MRGVLRDVPRGVRRRLGPIGIFLSLGLLVAIVIYSQYAFFRNSRGYSPSTSVYNPGQTLEQGAPESQELTAAELARMGSEGPLQKGVTPEEATVHLRIGTSTDFPAFDKSLLTVKHGQVVSLTFSNDSKPVYHYQDSWVLVRPNTAGAAGVAADRVGMQEGWIPHGSEILAHTRLLEPGQSQTITFRAPEKPGNYPFISTFPGHSQAMKGTLHVE